MTTILMYQNNFFSTFKVAYAHTGIKSNHGKRGSPALVRFLEDKEDEVALNHELRKYYEI